MASWRACASFDPAKLEPRPAVAAAAAPEHAPAPAAPQASARGEPPAHAAAERAPPLPEEPPPPDEPPPPPPPEEVLLIAPAAGSESRRKRRDHSPSVHVDDGRALDKRHKKSKVGRKRDDREKRHHKRSHAKSSKHAKIGKDDKARQERKRDRAEEQLNHGDEPIEIMSASEKQRMLERDQQVLTFDPRELKPSEWRVVGGQSYAFDVRGDRDNLAFGCQYHGHVPRYKRFYNGAEELAESSMLTQAKTHVVTGQRQVSAAALRRRYQRRKGNRVDPLDIGALFVAVGHAAFEGQKEGETDGRAAGNAGEPEDLSSDWSAEEELDGVEGAKLGGSVFERLRTLNEAVRLSPADEAAWEALAECGVGARKQGASERKVSVLRRAVATNPTSERLRLALLRACEGFLTAEQVEEEWEAALKSFPASVALWSRRLERFGRTFGSFTVGEMRALGQKSISALCGQLDLARIHNAVGAVEALERAALLLVLRVAYSERGAGFIERGVALMQALVEFNCFSPERLRDATLEEQLSEFETFWESELPRVGQPGAVGWSRWQSGQSAENLPLSAFGPPPLLPEELEAKAAVEGERPFDDPSPTRRICARWASREALATREGVIPVAAALYPDVADVDPERVMFFDDLRPFLFSLTSPAARRELLLEAAAFFALDGSGAHVPSSHPLAVLRSSFAEHERHLLALGPNTSSSEMGLLREGVGMEENGLACIGSQLMLIASRAFPCDEQLAYLAMRGAGSSGVRKIAKGLLKQQPSHLPLWLAYARAEADVGHLEEARRVYHSAIDHCAPPTGSASIADLMPLVYGALKLELGRCAISAAQEGHTARRATESTKLAAEAEALRLLVRVWVAETPTTSDVVPPRTVVLRARAASVRAAEEAIQAVTERASGGELDEILLYTVLVAALSEYLSLGRDAACRLIEKLLGMLGESSSGYSGDAHCGGLTRAIYRQAAPGALGHASSGSIKSLPILRGVASRAHELLLEEYIWLLRHDSALHPMPPGLIRRVVERGLVHFPANPVILDAFVHRRTVARSRFYLRRQIQSCCTTHPTCPQLWLCAVRLELSGTASATKDYASVAPDVGAERRARTLFEKALLPSSCGGCTALWRSYLELELRARRPEAASRLLLRSVQQCPGSKSMWCTALHPPLVRTVPLQQLHDALQLMAEKELRLRHEPPSLPDPRLEAPSDLQASQVEAQHPLVGMRNTPYSSFASKGGVQRSPAAASLDQGHATIGGTGFALSGRRADLAPPYEDKEPGIACGSKGQNSPEDTDNDSDEDSDESPDESA